MFTFSGLSNFLKTGHMDYIQFIVFIHEHVIYAPCFINHKSNVISQFIEYRFYGRSEVKILDIVREAASRKCR